LLLVINDLYLCIVKIIFMSFEISYLHKIIRIPNDNFSLVIDTLNKMTIDDWFLICVDNDKYFFRKEIKNDDWF